MGLLDKVEKKKAKPKEAVKAKRESPSTPKADKVEQTGKIDTSAIKKHVEKQIKKQETKKVTKPVVQFGGSKGGKTVVQRPEGALKQMKEESKKSEQIKPVPQKEDNSAPKNPKEGLDLGSIKAQIEAELKGNKKKKAASASTTSKNRISTGIPGLDDVMTGGFRKNTANLIAGGPGSGKSIFGMQFLTKGIDDSNEPGVYISFEQKEEEIIEDMEPFKWDIEKKIQDKKLVILSYTPEQVEKVLKAGGGTVRDVIESIKAKRVVIDSLTAFTLLHENQLAQRKACLALFGAIKRWNCTALLLAEHEGNPELHSPTVEEFEVDGVIVIYNIRKGDVRERALEIFKMRATKHSAKIFPMTISDDGMMIYPDQTVF